MSLNVLIVEDEVIIADDLSLSLEQAGYTVVGQADSAEAALTLLRHHAIDLVLLDIHIKGDQDGLYLARLIRDEYQLPYIFITSYYDEDTLAQVEQVNPAAYIVKPYKEEEVLMNVRLAVKKSVVPKKHIIKQKIFVRDSGFLKPVKGEDIIYAKGEDNYTRLVTEDNKEYVISQTLKSIEKKLPVDRFCRVHKSYVINIDHVQLIEGNSIQIGDQSIPIGKTYRSGLFNYLEVL